MSQDKQSAVRESKLILGGSPCDTNFYPDGPKTVAEYREKGKSLCPYYQKCKIEGGNSNSRTGWECLMRYALDVAGYVVKQGNTVKKEIGGEFRRFFVNTNPPGGYIYSSDRREFVFLKDKSEALKKIEEFAAQVVTGSPLTEAKGGSSSPLTSPVLHRTVGPTFNDVLAHSMTSDGAIDLARMEKLEGRFGYNGGRGCDVSSGPCSCGAWH